MSAPQGSAYCHAGIALATLFAAVSVATAAEAAIVICNQPTKNVSCSAGVCTATAKNATLNISDLVNMLGAGDVTVSTGTKAIDIDIGAPFSWASANRLTLSATGTVVVAHPVTVAGPGGLTIGQHSYTAVGAGHITFWDLSSSLIINTHHFKLVNSVPTLASAIAANQCQACALANNYDASVDGTYAAAPISSYSGWFEGLGNAISNLSIDDSANGRVGLIASLTGTVGNLALLQVSVTAHKSFNNGGTSVGALAGYADSAHVTTIRSSGHVTGPTTAYAGGILGSTLGVDEFTDNRSSAIISGGDYSRVGGLVGYYVGAAILQSDASGSVNSGLTSYAGGLVGYSNSFIYSSHATGSVTGGENATAGGLVGLFGGSDTLKTSYATGNVMVAKVSHGVAGGLVGLLQSGTVLQSYATGSVQGTQGGDVGGLVGKANSGSTISQSYAKGSATLPTYRGWSGGLVGEDSATLSQVYSIGQVTGGAAAFIGGLIGQDYGAGSNTAGFWDKDTSGIGNPSQGAGSPANDPGITGLTDAQLKSGLPAGFDPAVWGQSPTINNGYPYLLALPPG